MVSPISLLQRLSRNIYVPMSQYTQKEVVSRVENLSKSTTDAQDSHGEHFSFVLTSSSSFKFILAGV